MRTLEQTTQEVLDLAAKHFQLPSGSLAPDDDFFKKLGIDSLQTLEMLSRLENHFGIELPDYEVQGVSDSRLWLSGFNPACNAGPFQISIHRRGAAGCAGSVFKRRVFD